MGLTDPERPLHHPPPLPLPPPHHLRHGHGRGRHQSPAGGDLPGPQRGPLSGRAARVPQGACWRCCASPWRTGRCRSPGPPAAVTYPSPVHAGVRHEPLQVRLVRPPLRPLPLLRAARCERYLSRLSGPLLDRIDLFVEVAALEFERAVPPGPGGALRRHQGAGWTGPGPSRRAALSGRPRLQRPDGPAGAGPLLRPGLGAASG